MQYSGVQSQRALPSRVTNEGYDACLLFERLEAGELHLGDLLKVSEHASEQAPSKLDLKPGQTITVDDAIKGIVTKSANDAAVVVAENLGDTEKSFAKLMTQRARTLGMTNTTYVNVSGLPDDGQVTTAADQALLGRAIQERFPRYYKYFSTAALRLSGRNNAQSQSSAWCGGGRRRH